MRYVSPSVKETAFNCPHCGALAAQYWYSTHVNAMKKDTLPIIMDGKMLAALKFDNFEDEMERDRTTKWAERSAMGRPFFGEESKHAETDVDNVWLSRCFNCNEVAIWVYDGMIYPLRGEAPSANPDMPDDILRDYNEASTILDLSPRGAAALIRLGIQKMCIHLGQPGKNLNDDIGSLVAAGLDPRIQRALDTVRVIGNNAVHPGQMNLADDRATAESLFRLLNLIVQKMISEPKHIDDAYAGLPEESRKAIAKRDAT